MKWHTNTHRENLSGFVTDTVSCWYLNCSIDVVKNHFVSYGRQRCVSKGYTQVMLLFSKVIKYHPSKVEKAQCLLARRLLLPVTSSRAVGTRWLCVPSGNARPSRAWRLPSGGQPGQTSALSPAILPCSRRQRWFNVACQLFQVHLSKCTCTVLSPQCDQGPALQPPIPGAEPATENDSSLAHPC